MTGSLRRWFALGSLLRHGDGGQSKPRTTVKHLCTCGGEDFEDWDDVTTAGRAEVWWLWVEMDVPSETAEAGGWFDMSYR